MRPYDHAEVISLQEGIQVVYTEVDYVILFLRVSDEVVLEAGDIFTFVRITPQKIDYFLMIVYLVRTQLNFEWPLDFFDAVNISNSGSDPPVAAEYSLLFIGYDGCQRKIVESIIDFGKAAIGIVDIFIQSFCALISQTKIPINMPVFMVPSQQHNLAGVFQLQSH